MNYLKNIRFEKSITVELKLTTVAANGTLNFADVPQLKGAIVHAIEAFTDSQVTKTPSGNTVFANAAAKEMLMTFVEGNEEKVQLIPYYTLVAANNGGMIREFKDLKLNINKSNVFITGTTATANHALLFTIYYSKGA
jgi:hypothetical protein